MYWSIYDTLLLITGVLTAAIALIPIETIPPRTRVTCALIGGGVLVLSLILGNMPSFTYPGLVVVAPILPVLAGGAIVKTALDRRALDASMHPDTGAPAAHQYDEAGQARPGATTTVSTTEPARAAVPAPTHPGRDAAWAELHDPRTGPERLAAIATQHPEFAAAIGAHPQAYTELRAWAQATRQQETS